MTAKKLASSAFDVAEYLNDKAVIAAYLTAAAEDENPDVLLAALGDVAKAKGMAEISRKSGLGRESLYKALAAGAKPRHETVQSVLNAFGMKFRVVPASGPLARSTARGRVKPKKKVRRAESATA